MLTLALDTTTRDGSIALARDGCVLDTRIGDGSRTHAERLPLAIGSLLEQHGLDVADIGLFAVAAGPGSFTGLRIGIATIQGLAFGTGRPVVAVSALDALAAATAEAYRLARSQRPLPPAAFVGACMDAHRQEVFTALWRLTVDPAAPEAAIGTGDPMAGLEVVLGPSVDVPVAAFRRWASVVGPAWLWAAGDGFVAARGPAEAEVPALSIVEPVPPLAPAIAQLAAVRAEAGHAGAPHAVRPVYVRRPDAELARERGAIDPASSGRAPATGEPHER